MTNIEECVNNMRINGQVTHNWFVVDYVRDWVCFLMNFGASLLNVAFLCYFCVYYSNVMMDMLFISDALERFLHFALNGDLLILRWLQVVLTWS